MLEEKNELTNSREEKRKIEGDGNIKKSKAAKVIKGSQGDTKVDELQDGSAGNGEDVESSRRFGQKKPLTDNQMKRLDASQTNLEQKNTELTMVLVTASSSEMVDYISKKAMDKATGTAEKLKELLPKITNMIEARAATKADFTALFDPNQGCHKGWKG